MRGSCPARHRAASGGRRRRLSRGFGRPGCGVLAVTRVDGVDVLGQLLARRVRQAACQGECIAGLCGAGATGNAQAHLADGRLPRCTGRPNWGTRRAREGRTRRSKPGCPRGLRPRPPKPAAPPACAGSKRCVFGPSRYPRRVSIPTVCRLVTDDGALRENGLPLRVSSVEQGGKCRQINDLGNLCCMLTACCCALAREFPGGRGGIRTRGRLLTYTCFPGMRLKPLIHPSGVAGYSS